MNEFERELISLLNKYSIDNQLNTPDFILAHFIRVQLDAMQEMQESVRIWKL